MHPLAAKGQHFPARIDAKAAGTRKQFLALGVSEQEESVAADGGIHASLGCLHCALGKPTESHRGAHPLSVSDIRTPECVAD